jgi:hypothetical protein
MQDIRKDDPPKEKEREREGSKKERKKDLALKIM